MAKVFVLFIFVISLSIGFSFGEGSIEAKDGTTNQVKDSTKVEEGEEIREENLAEVKEEKTINEEIQQVGVTSVVIPSIKLKSGYEMPMFGLGTGRLGRYVTKITKEALLLGYRHIDTAAIFPASPGTNAEQAVGKAISGSNIPRKEIFLSTKIGPESFQKSKCKRAVEKSLKNLNTHYLDLVMYQYPTCYPGYPSCKGKETLQDGWRSLEALVDEGLIRSIGISNSYREDIVKIQEIARHPISVLQNWFDPYFQDSLLRLFCEERGIAYSGYSVLGIGWVDDGWKKNPVLEDEVILAIAKNRSCSATDVILKWALERNVVVIPGSKKAERVVQNLNSINLDLNTEELELLDKLDAKITPVEFMDESGIPIEKGFLQRMFEFIGSYFNFGKKEPSEEL